MAEEFPDGMSPDQIQHALKALLERPISSDANHVLKSLGAIADQQWHTYSEPDASVKKDLERWLGANWRLDDESLELVMGICYGFALSKATFERALAGYHGDQRWEYEEMLENSPRDSIDPYWSLREGQS